jgi:SPP1 gp7 family putative phage head morphogenesis protein
MANFSNLQSDLQKVFKSMYSGYDFPYEQVNGLITKIGGVVAADSYADFMKKFPNRAGMQEEWLASTFDNWRKNQIMRLMQAQQNQQLKIGRLINNARAEGKAYENVVKAYTGNMARKHAVFEMRNASANLNAAIDRNRMQEAGIDCYRWRTGNDEKVRPEHKEMQNKICRFDDPLVFYEERTKTWVPRTGDMVHKHPGEDYNCRCTASPYLMEIDEKTGKYAKGIDEAEDIEEALHEEETRKIREDWIAELKTSPDYVDKNGSSLKNTIKTARAMDNDNKPYVKEFLSAFQVKINSDKDLRQLMERTKIQFNFAKYKEGSFYYAKRIYINITCWLSGSRLNSAKMRFSTTLHELMHGAALQHKKYDTYIKNVYSAAYDDFKKFPEFGKIIENAKAGGKGLDALLQEHWKPFIRKSFEIGSSHIEQGISDIADYTHGILSEYMNAKQIEKLNLRKQIQKAVRNVNNEIDFRKKRITLHEPDYYLKANDRQRIEFVADEFQANMGSLYFTNRELFNAYKELLPNSMGLVENFIKEGKYE